MKEEGERTLLINRICLKKLYIKCKDETCNFIFRVSFLWFQEVGKSDLKKLGWDDKIDCNL